MLCYVMLCSYIEHCIVICEHISGSLLLFQVKIFNWKRRKIKLQTAEIAVTVYNECVKSVTYSFQSILAIKLITTTGNTFCETCYLPHSQVHNDRTVPIIMAGCIAHARNGRISTFGLKSDVTIVFVDLDFL